MYLQEDTPPKELKQGTKYSGYHLGRIIISMGHITCLAATGSWAGNKADTGFSPVESLNSAGDRSFLD
ncbi:MAG: hypothetical protein NT038_09120 [Euryarchaeota archaeon]|nr:hypothetical protein [Euryarchaeota archaeon]